MAMGIFMAASREMQGKVPQQEISGIPGVLESQDKRGKNSHSE